MNRQQQDADPWALLKYAEHCRLGGNPARTASLRVCAAAACSPITLAALEAEMPPPKTDHRPAPRPRHKPRRKHKTKPTQQSFKKGHAAFLEAERDRRAKERAARVSAIGGKPPSKAPPA